MSETGPIAHAVNVRGYLAVFAALLVLTVVTVAVASLDLTAGMTVTVAIVIAAFKATLVALFFMHLKGEKPMVFWSLGLTGVLLVALFAFVLWTEGDHLLGTRFGDAFGTTRTEGGLVAPKPQGGEGGPVSPKPQGGEGGPVSPKPQGGEGGGGH